MNNQCSQVEWLILKQLWSQTDADARRSKVCKLQIFSNTTQNLNGKSRFWFSFEPRNCLVSAIRRSWKFSEDNRKKWLAVSKSWWFSFSTEPFWRAFETRHPRLVRAPAMILNTLLGLRFIDQTGAQAFSKVCRKFIAGTTISNPSLPTSFSFTMIVRQQ